MIRQSTTPRQAPLPAIQKVELKKPTTTEDDMRYRAYEIYLKRSPNAGDEVSDWFQAEGELKGN